MNCAMNARTLSNQTQSHSGNPSGIRILNLNSDDDRWDSLVAASPQGSAFLRNDWLNMLQETDHRNLEFLRVGYFDTKEQLMGGWMLPYRNHLGLRCAAEGFDFFYAGPLLCPELSTPDMHHLTERHAVLTGLATYMRRETGLVVTETHPSLQDVRDFLFSGWIISPEYTHIWDMLHPEALLARMNREKRREVRRGLETYNFARMEGNEQAFDGFMHIYRATMRKFGRYPTLDWQTRLQRRLEWLLPRDGYRLYTAYTQSGDLAAGVLVLLSREDNTGYLWRMGHHPELGGSRVVPALYWWAALDLSRNKPQLRYINLGGSPLASLAQFKDYLVGQPTLHFRLIHRRYSVRLGLWWLEDRVRTQARRQVAKYPQLEKIQRVFR